MAITKPSNPSHCPHKATDWSGCLSMKGCSGQVKRLFVTAIMAALPRVRRLSIVNAASNRWRSHEHALQSNCSCRPYYRGTAEYGAFRVQALGGAAFRLHGRCNEAVQRIAI
jgi:hypothetical protein